MLVTAVLLIPDAAVSVPQSVADGVVAPKALVADPQVLSAMMLLRSVTAPKPPGSRQLISPPAAVFEIAPGNILHGAVRLHGFASSPTPETHVRVAWAEAEAGIASAISARAGRTLRRRRGVSTKEF